MGPLEKELRTQFRYELSGIEGVPEIILDAFDKQDATVFETHPVSEATVEAIHLAQVNFSVQSIYRLAREIDELRGAGAGGDDSS